MACTGCGLEYDAPSGIPARSSPSNSNVEGHTPVALASSGSPVLVPGVVRFQDRPLRPKEVGEGAQGLRGRLVAVELGLDRCLPLVCFGLSGVFQVGGNVLRARGIGSPSLELLGLQLASGHALVQLFLVLEFQLRDRVLPQPFDDRVVSVRGRGHCLVRIVDTCGFSIGGRGSGPMEVVLLF